MGERESTDFSQTEPTHMPLIHGLPDHIALFCLARVPRRYHTLLKCVSKRWRDLVCSEEWFSYRRKLKLDEAWIYAFCRDKSEQACCYVLDPNSSSSCWKPIHGLPSQCLKRKGMSFEVLGKKVYLMGGSDWFGDAKDEVYCYDASKNTWDEAAPLSTARCYFTCESLNEKLYAIGGVGLNSSDAITWDTYDPCTNSWTFHSDPNGVLNGNIEESVVMDGKIYINCGSCIIPPHVDSVMYEPSSNTWQQVDQDMVSGWCGPAIVVDGTLYVLDQSLGTKLMMWRKDTRDWVAVGRLSSQLTKPPCQLAAIGKIIFLIGKGLSTVAFDVSKAQSFQGVMVGSSIPKLASNDKVISCKILSI